MVGSTDDDDDDDDDHIRGKRKRNKTSVKRVMWRDGEKGRER